MTSAPQPAFPKLSHDEGADVCIVGAGIAGLTTAYLLTKAGKTVIVLDDGPIFSGETERTTAHLVTVLDKRYFELEQLHGEGGAKLAAESHAAAIDTIERIVCEERIDCDFERVDGYLFNAPDQPPDLLDRELAAARRAGLTNTELVDRAPPISFDTGRALRFQRQAQFSPLKYVAALAQSIVRGGGRIFTDTHATKFTGGKPAKVATRAGSIVSCEAIVIATNTPVNDWLIIQAKQAAYRSYVIGIAVPTGTVPKALYWDTGDPYHYIRLLETKTSGTTSAQDILLV
jgi:glycine/D-amino acid oxidase-like deaminating enzyme